MNTSFITKNPGTAGRSSKILYIDMDNVLVDFKTGINRIPESLREEYKGNLDDVPGIFSLMDPMPDAVEAFNLLADCYDTYILSTAPWKNPSAWSDKLIWVQTYLGDKAYKRLIISHHKNLNRGNFLVDDREKNGAKEFEGKLIQFGKDPFLNWQKVTEYLYLAWLHND